MAHIQKIAGPRGSATKESRTTWLRYKSEYDHVAQIQKRVGPRGSATKESRTMWLRYKRE